MKLEFLCLCSDISTDFTAETFSLTRQQIKRWIIITRKYTLLTIYLMGNEFVKALFMFAEFRIIYYEQFKNMLFRTSMYSRL